MRNLTPLQAENLHKMYLEAIELAAALSKEQFSSIPFHQDAERRSGWRHWQNLGSGRVMICPSPYKSFCIRVREIRSMELPEAELEKLLIELAEQALSGEP